MFNLGIIYEEQGERELAKDMYEEVLKVKPDHFKARVNLGIILEKEGQSKSAGKHYQDALKMRPNEAKIHHNMGINLKRAGKLQDALACYKHAMELEKQWHTEQMKVVKEEEVRTTGGCRRALLCTWAACQLCHIGTQLLGLQLHLLSLLRTPLLHD